MSTQHLVSSTPTISTDASFAMLLECEETLEDQQNFTSLFRLPNISIHMSIPYLSVLSEKETEYAVNATQWLAVQQKLNVEMRGILLDWLMEVAGEYRFKRETYYLAISHIDRYLMTQTVERDAFQLIGLAALSVAVKTEEIKVLKLEELAKAADYAYDEDAIRKAEMNLLKTLKWKIYPTTPYHWLNWLMTEWDQYIIEMFNVSYIEQDQFYAYDNEILKDVLEEERIVVYKQPNKTSYKRYREALLMLDMLYLEISTYFFASKEICVALLYILTKKYFEDTNYSLFLTHKQLAMHFYTEDANASDRLIQGSLILYELFSDFVAKTVEIHNLENLMVHFQLVSLYLGCMPSLNFRSQDLRKQTTNRDHIHLTYEEFLSAQTYNPEAWQTVNEIIKIKS